MLNRAKCKLCNKVIEIMEIEGIQVCDCQEIAIEYRNKGHIVICKHIENILAVDDEGNEIVVKAVEDQFSKAIEDKPTKKDLIKMLDKMIKDIEDLPPQAMSTYISQYDLMSALMLVSEIFKSKD